ncbi:hypothetical protein H6G89_19870 [Oscillatoria sp. FACHB-1407]|uniref:hypothetical protein n=1 Tax=Oscillatoria sp. FACHB-1407 TaxID=2692847 RepID=UPI001686B0E2|nr:hypothetical protein [Oscillatoria sp. FACHB-1407]MBD2463297.1 hypothetical protein [Oscillatoria sp. FACHB-1407]
MNSWLLERSPPTRTPDKAGFDEPTQVGFAPIAAVKTAEILIPNSRQIRFLFSQNQYLSHCLCPASLAVSQS